MARNRTPPLRTPRSLLVGALTATSLVTPVFGLGSALSTGESAPPGTLGPYSLTPFPFGYDDPRTGFVADVPSPLGGMLIFSSAMEILTVGSGWASWSHGFDGDVYAVDLAVLNPEGKYEVTLDLPVETGAFLFYAEPAVDGEFTITARLDDGTLLSQEVQGTAGAKGFGFWASPGSSLASITVSSEFENVDFAIGEFSIARAVVPEGGTVVVGGLMLGLLGVPVLRRLRR